MPFIPNIIEVCFLFVGWQLELIASSLFIHIDDVMLHIENWEADRIFGTGY